MCRTFSCEAQAYLGVRCAPKPIILPITCETMSNVCCKSLQCYYDAIVNNDCGCIAASHIMSRYYDDIGVITVFSGI